MTRAGATDDGVGNYSLKRVLRTGDRKKIDGRFRERMHGPITIRDDIYNLEGIEQIAADPERTKKRDDVYSVDFTYSKRFAQVTVVTPGLHPTTCGWQIKPKGVVKHEIFDPADYSPDRKDQYGLLWRFVMREDELRENEFGIAQIRAEDVTTIDTDTWERGDSMMSNHPRRFNFAHISEWVAFLNIGHQVATGKALKQMGADYLGKTGNNWHYRGPTVESTRPLRTLESALSVHQAMAVFGHAPAFSQSQLSRAASNLRLGRRDTERYWLDLEERQAA